ncbi:Uma2 family endonuclease [Streptosporangium longisporum]|uniref:Uma2 family endonuclease n=1 Tax=Streptosporangium longisporum TaxID=46187 RepID=A0ABN3XXD0_9ACTN
MAKTLDRREAKPMSANHQELERHYQRTCDQWPDRKVEIINGRIVVRELPTLTHARIITRLLLQLAPFATEQGWDPVCDIKIFFGVQKDRYRPDLLVLPKSPRLWDDENVYAEETLLVVEVVSPSSRNDDHVVKPENCAIAGVPLYLVIDAFQNIARLLSHPGERGYQQQHQVTLGEPLELPAPWNLTIDTGRLVEI